MVMMRAAPPVIGDLPLSVLVGFLCVMHLLICIVFIGVVDSTGPVMVAGITIGPMIQCANAAWFLLGIPVVIHALVGTIFKLESNLAMYFGYLVGTMVLSSIWVATMVAYGNTCKTISTVAAGSNEARYVCGLSNGVSVFGMVITLGVVLAMIYLVWSLKNYYKERAQTLLCQYQDHWKSFAANTAAAMYTNTCQTGAAGYRSPGFYAAAKPQLGPYAYRPGMPMY